MAAPMIARDVASNCYSDRSNEVVVVTGPVRRHRSEGAGLKARSHPGANPIEVCSGECDAVGVVRRTPCRKPEVQCRRRQKRDGPGLRLMEPSECFRARSLYFVAH
jgi:hypothetical protein